MTQVDPFPFFEFSPFCNEVPFNLNLFFCDVTKGFVYKDPPTVKATEKQGVGV